MSSKSLSDKNLSQFGLKATWIYLIILFGGIPVSVLLGGINLKPLSLNELGDFLAGAFGPLAIFWLVLGFFQQGKELRASVEALNIQAGELNNSVEQQKAMVEVTQRQLEIDEAAFKENSLVRQEAEMPHLVVSQNGGSTSGGRRLYKYKVTNIGKPAARIMLTISPKLGSVYPTEFRAVSSENETDFHVEFDTKSSHPDYEQEHELTLISENQLGRTKTQVFRLFRSDVTPTHTTIESVGF